MQTKHVLFAIVGVVGLGVVGYLVSPLFYDRVVKEDLPVATFPSVMSTTTDVVPSPIVSTANATSSGTFVGLQGHRASGTASRLAIDGKDYVRFEEDFFVTNGPDLFVYLGKDGQIDLEKRLGALKGNKGSQNYAVPLEWRDQYNEVWVWCRAFSVSFARAELR